MLQRSEDFCAVVHACAGAKLLAHGSQLANSWTGVHGQAWLYDCTLSAYGPTDLGTFRPVHLISACRSELGIKWNCPLKIVIEHQSSLWTAGAGFVACSDWRFSAALSASTLKIQSLKLFVVLMSWARRWSTSIADTPTRWVFSWSQRQAHSWHVVDRWQSTPMAYIMLSYVFAPFKNRVQSNFTPVTYFTCSNRANSSSGSCIWDIITLLLQIEMSTFREMKPVQLWPAAMHSSSPFCTEPCFHSVIQDRILISQHDHGTG